MGFEVYVGPGCVFQPHVQQYINRCWSKAVPSHTIDDIYKQITKAPFLQ